MNQIKSCISCKHCENPDAVLYFWCNKYATKTIDYVRGEVIIERSLCDSLRKSDGSCKPEGIGWEQRPPEKHMNKMIRMIKDFFDL